MPGRSSRAGWDKHAGLVQWLRPEAGAFCSLELDRDRFPGAGDVDRLLARVRDGGTSVALGPWFGESTHVLRAAPRGSQRRSAMLRLTLSNQPWPGATRASPPICVAGCLLAILFLASQNRVFGVFAHCRAPRSLVLSIRRG